MLKALAKMQRYIRVMTYYSYQANEFVRDAVERNFIMLGEAATNVPAHIQARDPSIPWAVMRAVRHRVVYDYGTVDQFVL